MASASLGAEYDDILETVPLPPGAQIEAGPLAYEHDGTELEGYIARDTAVGERRAAVLLVHDWTGVGANVQMRAHMLARLGYVALAADIYGAGVRPTGDAASAEANTYYADLPLLRSRVRAGFDALAAQHDVDPDRIVVAGYCFGGTAALEFARTGAPARGIVSFHGGLITHDPSDAGAIRAPLLIFNGGADPVVPDEKVHEFQDELRAAPDVQWQMTTYSGAPHAFTVPGSDRYRPLADARSWRDFVGFLFETVG
jgi:dienelactone hydrolase